MPPSLSLRFTQRNTFLRYYHRHWDPAVRQRALTAYRFCYPTVPIEGLYNGYRENGILGRRNASAKRR
jgi:hypothetical protein